jgi:regulator of protease activity HflC (stomatin/prohibitin superfamily)
MKSERLWTTSVVLRRTPHSVERRSPRIAGDPVRRSVREAVYRSERPMQPSSIMERRSSFPALIFIAIALAGGALAYGIYGSAGATASLAVFVVAIVIAASVARAIRVASAWERAVVLRLGKFRGLSGPGLFGIVPIVDTIPYWIDVRVITSSFKAEKTLTKDTVPVDVDAVLFWKVVDPEKAALAVADYHAAINWAAQTALRDVIGKTLLADMLEGRQRMSLDLRQVIDAQTESWGVSVLSVEVRDINIPAGLQDAMSMQAQAERERQARVILGDSERQIAEKFGEAARTYANDPTALHLRAMNMLYEGLKQNATIVLVPSSAVESMQLGSIAGITSLAAEVNQQTQPTRH